MEPSVTVGPAPSLERTLLWLVPPPVREELAGDLFERYRSPGSYLIDLVRALPYVVWSQMRRVTDPVLFGLIAFTLIASLGGLEPGRGAPGVPIPLRALVAAFPSLAVLLLRNAYRRDETWSGLRCAGDVASLAITLFLWEAALGFSLPGWQLPVGWAVGGFTFTAIIMILLRSSIELANTGLRPGLATVPDPQADLRRFRRNVRLRAVIETGVLAVPALVAAWFALTANRPVVAGIAGLWALLTLLLVLYRGLRGAGSKEAIAEEPSRESVSRYLAELDHQRRAGTLAWCWYFAPLFAGIAFSTIALGIVAQRPLPAFIGFAACAALATMIALVAGRQSERLSEKIEQLQRTARNLPA